MGENPDSSSSATSVSSDSAIDSRAAILSVTSASGFGDNSASREIPVLGDDPGGLISIDMVIVSS